MVNKKRRYDLDWFRVIAILAVYVHHICMPFNGDKFHIMNLDSSKLLDDIMVFFEQFRLPLLFLISGTGTMLAFSKRTWFQFLKERSTRLIIPLVFGIFFIIPPQTYYEYIDKYTNYIEVYKSGLFPTNHLWFIENLFVLSVVLIPLILLIKSSKSIKFINALDVISSKTYGILLWVIPLLIGTILLKKIYPDESKNITNLSSTFYYGYFFISGILFATSKNIWKYLKLHRKLNLIAFIVSSILFYTYYFLPNEYVSPYVSKSVRWSIWYVVCALVSWTLITTLLGYGQIWFHKKSELLKKCNEAIYPFYILHQTIIIVVGYYIIQLQMSISSKIVLLVFTTFPLIIIIYRLLIYPFKITRILFGMKKRDKFNK
ncbi:acyltransferase family protein [Cellulophaga fucicola]|uniref:Surface polysaccharide O-acyltransferase, integral membrane enzyme n=1 Tax=Cellulophaga fucicola TaxID=76595 RepID=A0A1K1MHP5_9FLAO|nr:acyltransferase [Cellulophaga fucicola]SFW21454.1 Surface polysaccharide O-acyltransferase, integral membrane enzyme [Cellulophaga fucicola]